MDLKKGVLVLFLLVSLIFAGLIFAQDADAIPVNPADKVTDSVGGYSEKGYPESYEKYIEFSNSLVEREQDQKFWKKSLTGIWAGSPVLGSITYHTDKFFSFFDPIWNVIFGIDFDWSWEFFFHLVIFITLIVIIFYPAEVIFDNKLFGLISAMVISSLVGVAGVIGQFAGILEVMFVNLFYLTIGVILIIAGIVFYAKFFNKGKKKTEEEEIKKAKENIKAHGEISKKALEKYSEDE
jgi:hypothetical protein|tara:strand:+ start:673 stop:1386 length:714 start_codon:yes stop_codon:yes gene_type:complete